MATVGYCLAFSRVENEKFNPLHCKEEITNQKKMVLYQKFYTFIIGGEKKKKKKRIKSSSSHASTGMRRDSYTSNDFPKQKNKKSISTREKDERR